MTEKHQNTDQAKLKALQAERILFSCIGKNGFWASDDRYIYQCWTRDFVIAVLPLILEMKNRPDYLAVAKRHLDQLAKRQTENGQIPILFLDDTWKWLKIKIRNCVENKRKSFMFKQFCSPDGVFNLTPWTKDSELLYVLGVGMYYAKTGDMAFIERHCKSVDLAFKYIEENLLFKHLIMGSDWRDTRPDHSRRMLLTNNCFLYEAYRLHGMNLQAEKLKKKIKKYFWDDNYFLDFVGSIDFDTFGNALAILFEVSKQKYIAKIFESAEELNTPFGYRLNGVTLPPKDAKEAELMQRINQNGVIWPYIHGFMTLALAKSEGYESEAFEAFEKFMRQTNFYEFYDPQTGSGHGSSNQLWSACLYLRCYNAMQEKEII